MQKNLMKKQIFIWMLALTTAFSIAGCAIGGGESVNLLLTILSRGDGTWRVRNATFGSEEAPLDMFKDYRITFRADGSYQVTNPDGVPSFTRSPNGTYTVSDRLLTFDGGATVATEVTVGPLSLNSGRLVFEFDVVLPGKSAARYRFELVK
jgi:hypothetical protein